MKTSLFTLAFVALSSVACGSGLRDYYISPPGKAAAAPSACDKTAQDGPWHVAGNDDLGDFATKSDALACATYMFGKTSPLAVRDEMPIDKAAPSVKALITDRSVLALNQK